MMENLKFGTASFDKVPLLKEYQGRVKPVFLVFKDGKRVRKRLLSGGAGLV